MALIAVLCMTTVGWSQEQAPKPDEASAPGKIEFTGTNSMFTNTGIFPSWKFTKVEIPNGDVEKGVVELEIDLNEIETNRGERLIKHLKSADFFDVAKFPTAKLTIREAKPVEDQPSQYIAKATMEIRKAKVDFDIPFIYLANTHRVRGEVTLSRTALTVGEPEKKLDPLSIDDAVKVVFEAQLPRAAFQTTSAEAQDDPVQAP
ncbi:YceI family protein [Candidatus Sumerlaeota bacterium]|nr:YceI family protein [Candidatus Sumerlaeota bacterium]